MKLLFMGTPEFAVPSLRALYEAGHQIEGVFTQPDRPSGRGNRIMASQVKVETERLNLPVYQPLQVKAPEVVNTIRKLNPDCIVVVAFGQILSKEILEIPRFGCVNVHASLLPAYRGAAPIHWAVINGESLTGVTTMRMDEGLDTGDMLLTEKFEISPFVSTGEVHDALAKIGARVLTKTLVELEHGSLKPIPQPEEFTYAPLLKREHEKIDWSWNVEKVHNRIRGLNPWPGAYTMFRNEPVKIWKSTIPAQTHASDLQNFSAGQIIGLAGDGLRVRGGDGIIDIIELQPAGKKKMSAHSFFNGRQIRLGEFFE